MPKLISIIFFSFLIEFSSSFTPNVVQQPIQFAFVPNLGRFLTLSATRRNSYPPECEILLKSPIQDSEIRAERKEHERLNERRFAVGQQLVELRESLANLRENLKYSIVSKCQERVISLSEAIRNAERRDPEHVYTNKLVEMYNSKNVALSDYNKLEDEAKGAREFIDHFNLHGLWVGKYADIGYQMINVTYDGDMLIAKKVAGNGTLSNGEIMMEIDLHPVTPLGTPKIIDKVSISQAMAERFGSPAELNRFQGKGIVVGNDSITKGYLVSVGNFISFAWDPTSVQNHVFFGRPDFDLTIHLLSEYDDGYKLINEKTQLSHLFDLDISSDVSDGFR